MVPSSSQSDLTSQGTVVECDTVVLKALDELRLDRALEEVIAALTDIWTFPTVLVTELLMRWTKRLVLFSMKF